jgi:hypothetical protein
MANDLINININILTIDYNCQQIKAVYDKVIIVVEISTRYLGFDSIDTNFISSSHGDYTSDD